MSSRRCGFALQPLLLALLSSLISTTNGEGICMMQYTMADNDLYQWLVNDINELQRSSFIQAPNVTTWVYVDGNPRVETTNVQIRGVLLPHGSPAPGLTEGNLNLGVRYLNWNHTSSALVLKQELGEVNSDTPGAVSDYLKVALADCVAQGRTEYILVMSSHGSGFSFGHDETKARRLSQSNDDIAGAIRTALDATPGAPAKLTVLGFDACLQATLSAMEDFQNVTQYYMASEALEPGTGYNYSAWKPVSTAVEAAKANVDSFVTTPSYKKNGVWYHQGPKTLGVFDLQALALFYTEWEALSAELSKIMAPHNDTHFFSTLTRSRAETAGFQAGFDRPTGEPNEIFSFMDIGSFLTVFSGQCDPVGNPLALALEKTRAAYENLVSYFGKGPLTPQPVTGATIGWISRKRFLSNPAKYAPKIFDETSITRTANTPFYDQFLKDYLYYNKTKDVPGIMGNSVCGCSGVAVPPAGKLMWNQSVALSADKSRVNIGSKIADTVDSVIVEYGLDISKVFLGLNDTNTDPTVEASKKDASFRKLQQISADAIARWKDRVFSESGGKRNNNNHRMRKSRASKRNADGRRRLQQEDGFVQGDTSQDYVLMFGGMVYPDFDCDSFDATWDKNFYVMVNVTDGAVEDFLYTYRDSSGANTVPVFYFPESVATDDVMLQLQTGMEALELSIEDVESLGGLWSEMVFDSKQLQEWDNHLPMDLVALYAPSPDGSMGQIAPSEGGYILPILYIEAEVEGFVLIDYFIGGLSQKIVEWSEDVPLDITQLSAENAAWALESDTSVIDLVAYEWVSEDKEPVQQFDYYLLYHGEDGSIGEIEGPSRETPTDDNSTSLAGNGTTPAGTDPNATSATPLPAPKGVCTVRGGPNARKEGNSVICDGTDVCQNAVISGCDTVTCGERDCSGATITDSGAVVCQGESACRQATIGTALAPVDHVTCQGAAWTCYQATMVANLTVICDDNSGEGNRAKNGVCGFTTLDTPCLQCIGTNHGCGASEDCKLGGQPCPEFRYGGLTCEAACPEGEQCKMNATSPSVGSGACSWSRLFGSLMALGTAWLLL